MPEKELKEGLYLQFAGDYVPEGYQGRHYQIQGVEGFEYTHTFAAAVASGSASGFENIEQLEPDDRPFHLLFVQWGIKDGLSYQLKLPTGTNRLGIDKDKDVARLDNRMNPYYAPEERYAFYLIHDQYPAINAINATPASVTPVIYFTGEKFDLLEVTDSEILTRLKDFETRKTPYIPSQKISLGGVM